MKTQANITSNTLKRNLYEKLFLTLLLNIAIFNLATYAQKAELVVQTGHSSNPYYIAFSPDGKLFASASSKEIKLWDLKSRLEIRTFNSDRDDSIQPIAFNNDGTLLASGNFDGFLTIWNVETGQSVWKSHKNPGKTLSIAFSPDGKLLAIGGGDFNIQLMNTKTGQLLKTLKGHADIVRSVAFSPDGKTLATFSLDGTVRFWDVNTGTILLVSKVFDPVKIVFKEFKMSVTFSRDGERLAMFFSFALSFLDVKNGQILEQFEKSPLRAVNIAFSPDEKIFATAEPLGIKLRNVDDGKELKTLTIDRLYRGQIEFSPDGKILAAIGENKEVRFWDIESGLELQSLVSHVSVNIKAVFSPNGQFLASQRTNGTVNIWDLRTGQISRTLTINPLEYNSEEYNSDTIGFPAFSPDSRMLMSSLTKKYSKVDEGFGIIKLWDVITGKELRTLNFKEWVLGFFSPDGKTLLVVSNNPKNPKIWSVNLFNGDVIEVATPPEWFKIDRDFVRKFWENQSTLQINDISIKAIADEAKVKLVKSDTNQEVASLVVLDENDWAAVTPEGLFDASPGARKLMHYVIGFEPINLEQMKDVYYVPNLLQKIFKGDPLPKVELFSKKDLFPDVEFSQPKAGQKDLTFKLINRGGGIGEVQILVNGKEFRKFTPAVDFDAKSNETTLNVSLKDAPLYNDGKNKIEVVARNASGSLTNRGTARGTQIINLAGNEKWETPNIYAIVGGISNYTGDNLKLNFAAKDAEEMAKAIEIGATKLLGDQSKVHIRLLTSDGADSNVKFTSTDARISTATKENFQKAFADFKNATPNDVFIVYLAGHGVALNLNQNPNQAGGDTYLYLTQEATTTDKSVLAIENSRQAMAISSEELKDLMKQNKALKQVLILDTCASGQAAQSFVQKRDLPSDQIRAIERLKDNTGFYVLMGSAADAVSYEASQYGQGLLTYSLLQGMKGAKLRENQFADVSLLFDYAQTTVPQMAKNIGGIQQPRIITPDTSRSFDIGKFTGEEQKQINLSNPKPIFLTPTLFNPAANRDNLKLSKMMAEQLRTLSYISARGANSSIVYVETDEMVDGIQPSGSYTVEGDTLKISVILVKNNQPVGKEIMVTGKASEPEKAIKQLVESVIKSMS